MAGVDEDYALEIVLITKIDGDLQKLWIENFSHRERQFFQMVLHL